MRKKSAVLISEHLNDRSPSVRRQCALALGKLALSGRAYARQIAALLNSPEIGVRRAAMQALGAMGAQGAHFAPQIAALLSDPEPETRRSAMQALQVMGRGREVRCTNRAVAKGSGHGSPIRCHARHSPKWEGRCEICTTDSHMFHGSERPSSGARGSEFEEMDVPLDVQTLLACFEAVHAGRRSEAGRARLLAYLTSSVNSTNITLLRSLGHRTDEERPKVGSPEEIRKSMPVVWSVWPLLQTYRDTKKEAAEVWRHSPAQENGKLPTYHAAGLQSDLQSAGLFSQASEVGNVIARIQGLFGARIAVGFCSKL